MEKLKIVVISKYLFPQLTPRAFRTTELAEELARQGHDVTIYAVLGDYDYSSFEKETNVKVRNMKMLFATANSDGNVRYNLFDKILYHGLNRIFDFPDIEFLFKVLSVIKVEKSADMLITIAVPHSIHWGGALAKNIYHKSFPKTWVSDCGDPYMGSSFSGNKRKYLLHFKLLEKWWCKNTNYITIPIEEGRNGYYSEFHNKIKIIPQGFNFEKTPIDVYSKNIVPTFIYAGSFHGKLRNPEKFLEFLNTLDFDYKFIIYTNTKLFDKYLSLLKGKLEIKDYIPRKNLIFELSKADFLINFSNPDKLHSPSKLIDYSITRRPILNISSDFTEETVFYEFIENNYTNMVEFDNLEDYNIKNVAKKFLTLCKKND
ncbi:hypothetical protein [Polaribacter atrinae]|uniref:hypothetical protein n=1 Tax=Polaribacter atrinae TaxID=1333662 RepID=UPI0030FBF31E